MKKSTIAARLLEDDEVDPKEFAMSTPVIHVLTAPYSREQLAAAKDGNVSAVLEFDLWEILGCDTDALNDNVSEQITGTTYGLTGIGYDVVGLSEGRGTGKNLLIKVTGNVSDWLTYSDE